MKIQMCSTKQSLKIRSLSAAVKYDSDPSSRNINEAAAAVLTLTCVTWRTIDYRYKRILHIRFLSSLNYENTREMLIILILEANAAKLNIEHIFY